MSDDHNQIVVHEAGDLDQQISAITRLAHSGRPADEAQYHALQPRLLELVELKTKGVRSAPAVRAGADGGPVAGLADFPPLPTNKGFGPWDHHAYQRALPALAKQGFTTRQASAIADILAAGFEQAQAEKNAEERRQGEQVLEAQRREAQRIMATRYGSGWEQRLAEAKSVLRRACKHDKGTSMASWMLSNGEILGDRVEWASMVIDFAEGR